MLRKDLKEQLYINSIYLFAAPLRVAYALGVGSLEFSLSALVPMWVPCDENGKRGILCGLGVDDPYY